MRPFPEKSLPRAHAGHVQQSFHFQKITETLKINFFDHMQIPSVYFKEQLPKKKIWNSVWFNIFAGPQNGFWSK